MATVDGNHAPLCDGSISFKGVNLKSASAGNANDQEFPPLHKEKNEDRQHAVIFLMMNYEPIISIMAHESFDFRDHRGRIPQVSVRLKRSAPQFASELPPEKPSLLRGGKE